MLRYHYTVSAKIKERVSMGADLSVICELSGGAADSHTVLQA